MFAVKSPTTWTGLLIGLVFGTAVGLYLTSSRLPQAEAQDTRPTLASLQMQINTLQSQIDAINANKLDVDATATDSKELNGVAASKFARIDVDEVFEGNVSINNALFLGFSTAQGYSAIGGLRYNSTTKRVELNDGTRWVGLASLDDLQ